MPRGISESGPNSSTAKILLVLEAAGEKGVTSADIAQTAGMPAGTASSQITALRYSKVVNLCNPGARPMFYCLARFGGTWVSPNSAKQPEAAPASEILRVVLDLGGERKSLTLAQARSCYNQLKELFANGHPRA